MAWSRSPHHHQQLQHWQQLCCDYVACDLLDFSFPNRKFNDQTFAAPTDISTLRYTHPPTLSILTLSILKSWSSFLRKVCTFAETPQGGFLSKWTTVGLCGIAPGWGTSITWSQGPAHGGWCWYQTFKGTSKATIFQRCKQARLHRFAPEFVIWKSGTLNCWTYGMFIWMILLFCGSCIVSVFVASGFQMTCWQSLWPWYLGTGLLLPAAHVVCDVCDSSDLGYAVTNLVLSRSAFALHPLLGAPHHTHTPLWGFAFDLFIRSGSRTWELALPCPNLGSVNYGRRRREKRKDPNEEGIG